jgi:hypothetical protein
MNGAICIAVYNSYWFGITNFGWLQRFVDRVSNPGLVTAGKPMIEGCSNSLTCFLPVFSIFKV